MRRTDPYAAHSEFIAPARAASAPVRVIMVILGFEVLLGLTGWLTFQMLPDDRAFPDSTPFGTVVGFASFGLLLIGFLALVQLVHNRGLLSLTGPVGQVWHDGIRALGAVGALLVAVEVLMPSFTLADVLETRSFGTWAAMLPLAFLAIAMQCATEEIVYRGYLQQQLAVITRSRWTFILAPSVIFGAGHYWNGWGPSDGILYAYWATLLGIACADLTARTGSLGAAIGLHTANNLYATLIVAELDGPSSGLALFLVEQVDWESFDYGLDTLISAWTLFDIAFSTLIIFVMWLAARIAVRR